MIDLAQHFTPAWRINKAEASARETQDLLRVLRRRAHRQGRKEDAAIFQHLRSSLYVAAYETNLLKDILNPTRP